MDLIQDNHDAESLLACGIWSSETLVEMHDLGNMIYKEILTSMTSQSQG